MKRIGSVVVWVALLATVTSGQAAGSAPPALLKTSFGKLPIYFIENRGIYPDEVTYYVQGVNKTLFFTKDGVTFRLKGKDRGWVVKLEFVGANPEVEPRGEDRQQAVFSYFKGPEKDWKAGLGTFCKVVYEDLWPGIDLVYRGTANQLKYEFVVKPGSDPGKIRLRYRGAMRVAVTESGGLRVETPVGCFEDTSPVAWQKVGGDRVHVDMAFTSAGEGGHEFGFRVGEYDCARPLILDPVIFVYCGYIGGTDRDEAFDIAVDASGSVYVTGVTASVGTSFPVRAGPYTTNKGNIDAFVAKVNAAGTSLVYCGFIGGTMLDVGEAIAVDASGNAYVAGWTTSNQATFPVNVGPDLSHNGGLVAFPVDAFVAKVNALGTGLDYCGFIGGANIDFCRGIAVDLAGNAYVIGDTRSFETSFPVTVGPDLTYNGSANGDDDAFVAKVNPAGTGLVYCGYIGGRFEEEGHGIAVDAAGNAYVTGYTRSDEQTFPVKVGPDLTFNDNGRSTDAFVAKVNTKGTGLDYCGYIGGGVKDEGFGIAVDAAGNAFVTGFTWSDHQTFPVTVGPDLTYNGNQEAFVAKVSASGKSLAYCGYIGGSLNDWGRRIAVGASGHAFVAGRASSDENTFPVKVGPDLTHGGGPTGYSYDAFVAKVDTKGSALVYCGYIGGSDRDEGRGIAVDASGDAFIAGCTFSTQSTFPVKTGPVLTYSGGFHDAFVAKISLRDDLTASGTYRPGGTVALDLAAAEVRGLPYQVGSSLGTGPIHIGNRMVGLDPDDLLLVSIYGLWPWVFQGYHGVLDMNGRARATIRIPNIPALIDVRFHTAFVTHHPTAPFGVKSISNTVSLTITK